MTANCLDLMDLQAELDRLYRIHAAALCDTDCSFCADLELSDSPSYAEELTRIQEKKRDRLKQSRKSKK